MAEFVRNNAWNSSGNFANTDLLWYAKGVEAMMNRGLNDPASWWFYAAIHGEYVNPNTAWYPDPPAFPGWGFITSPPKVPTTPLPDQAALDLYWNQCQHGSWYFLPWHRGYLMSLEIQLRQDIVSQGGPDTWALPYWNYFGGTNGSQYQMPPAFASKTLPDGSANALYVEMRYGPRGDGNIFIPCPPRFPNGPVNAKAMNNDLFTGSDASTPLPGFGGPKTTFSHNGSPHGNFESNPHDLVHGYVGGAPSPTSPIYGLMADPGTAALDPIFYLHHCNIDRMWASWNANGDANPADTDWSDGPAQQFAMPGPGGKPWYYTPGQVQDLNKLDYSYQELTTEAAEPTLALSDRLNVLGAKPTPPTLKAATRATPKQTELLGASPLALTIGKTPIKTSVKLDNEIRHTAAVSFAKVSDAAEASPDKAFLKLENVSGIFDATVLGVYVNLPESKSAGESEKFLAGHVSLFGLRRATIKDGQHGGEGLTFILDITPFLDQLHLTKALDTDSLQVSIVPDKPLPDATEVKIGRISIYRQAF
nr:tyrosinase family protein [uncultured Dyadobacter sp.]